MVRVRNHCLLVLLLLLAGSAYAGANQSSTDSQVALPEKFYVPKGTSVKLELTQGVSSEAANVGDRLKFKVVEEVRIGDLVLFEKGSEADGFVSDVMSQRLWGVGRVEIYVSSVLTRSGFSLPVYGVFSVDGRSPSGAGAAAVIPEGTVLVAKTELDIPLDKDLFAQPVAETPSKGSAGE